MHPFPTGGMQSLQSRAAPSCYGFRLATSVLVRALITAAALQFCCRSSSRAFFHLPSVLRPPVLVLPGFGNDKDDYMSGELVASGAIAEDGGLVGRLRKRGFEHVEVLPVARPDWLRILVGLFDADFREGSAPPETAFGWYLERVDKAVAQMRVSSGQRVLLLAHSAGGWLARAALGRNHGALASNVSALVTLGSPHSAPPKEPPGDDQTRGALSYVDNNFPGAALRAKGVEYVTIAGSAVQGDGNAARGTPEREAWISYLRLVGRGDVSGDGIVALSGAHLDGATQVTLPQAKHSIGTPKEWYGSNDVIDTWLPQVTLTLARQAASQSIMSLLHGLEG
mmetsp:Transcript_110299/g.213550  ORF Transcript_110299/g.213550 Transcript_110299/m.213550 type:complete len:339 (+) Transcript_110299:8-1024(+)